MIKLLQFALSIRFQYLEELDVHSLPFFPSSFHLFLFGMFSVFSSLQLLGSLDILQGFVPVAEATYLRESSSNVGSPLVSPHQSPAFSPMVDGHTRRNKPSGFAQLELSRILHILVAVHLDGTIILCSVIEKGLSHANEITPERWVAVFDAVCASVAHEQQVLAVGTRRGTVELFNLADSALPLRTISLFDWGLVSSTFLGFLHGICFKMTLS
jgi:hypothetical protein